MIYEKYIELKNNDNSYLYLFKCGVFYIAVDDDCDVLAYFFNFKKSLLNNKIYKCGFPVSRLNYYLKLLNDYNIKYIVIDNLCKNNSNIIDVIKKLDLNNISPIMALDILTDLKEKVK
ncbi:MAG: hypothetical protein RSC92_04370 [Clostridia bacterium]